MFVQFIGRCRNKDGKMTTNEEIGTDKLEAAWTNKKASSNGRENLFEILIHQDANHIEFVGRFL